MKTFITLLVLFSPLIINAQTLQKHQDNDRVLLLLTSDTTGEDYQEQLLEIKQNLLGYAERALVVYTITPSYYQSVKLETKENADKTNAQYVSSNLLFEEYSTSKAFEVYLIDYDGTIVLHKLQVISSEELFSAIDSLEKQK